MKSQTNQLLEKMNKCHIHIKQNSKPSIHFKKIVLTYHWSLAVNKLQKIFTLRCKQPLEKIKNQDLYIKQSRSEQNSQIFKNKQSNKHVRYRKMDFFFDILITEQYLFRLDEQHAQIIQRGNNLDRLYLSQQSQKVETYSQLDSDFISEESNDPEQSQRNTHAQNKSQNLDTAKIENQQSELKQSAYFKSQNSLDQLKFNEEFLDLFKKQKELSQFGQLCQNKAKEQEMLIQKIIESRPCKPHQDLHIFLSLMKKPQIEVQQHAKITHQNEQPPDLHVYNSLIHIIKIYNAKTILYCIFNSNAGLDEISNEGCYSQFRKFLNISLLRKNIILILIYNNKSNQIKKRRKIKKVIKIKCIEFTAPSCCDPILKKVTFPDKFVDIPQILVTIRAIEYDAGPVGFFCQIQDVTEQDFTFQLTVLHATLKVLAYEYIAINQDEVEFGYFNVDALSILKKAEAGDKVIPSLLTFKRTFTEDPIVQVFLVGVESQSKLIQFEVSPLTVSLHGVQLNFKKFGETSVQKVQLAYVATQSSRELAQQVTHTGQKQAHIEPVDHEEESKSSEKVEETKEFLQLRSKPKLIQINGINGLRFTSLPVAFMWQGDQIDPTALNVNLRITLDKGNQAVLGLYYFEEKEYKKCPIVYSMCNYQGSKVYLCKDVSDFNSIMRLAKSIYIPEKTSVVVYQDPSYSGAKSKITKSIPCISDWFTDVAETEMSDIKQFLQINQMKRHKDLEFKEIHLENQKQLNKFNMVQLPRWNEAEKIEVVQAILDSNSPPANSYKQELIQKLNEEEETFLKNRQIY